jgi:outer membrane receptor for ferrienterochelin and colicins
MTIRSYLACATLLSTAAASLHAQTAQTTTATDLGRVEVTSGRDNDTQQRRESTASKIVIGREEIERQGDANIGEILKRQPGITLDGVPGRGGGIRMRGLSQGYTQILLDGQRVPPGFSIDSLTPEMVERIEIYRAPTAETGAQAIAGTINIITREGRRGMPSELKVGAGFQGGYSSPTASLVQYRDSERWSANYTLSANRWSGPDHSETNLDHQGAPGNYTRQRISDTHYERQGVNASARLQFKGVPGESLTLMPFIATSHGVSAGALNASLDGNGGQAASYNDNRFTISRLNGQWRRKLSNDSNMEWKFNVGGWNSINRYNQGGIAAANLNGLSEETQTQDRSVNLSGKYTHVLGGGHQWVSGAETEAGRRHQSALTSYPTGTGDFSAQTNRYALFTQDEWQFTPKWAAHIGARYESLTTQGNNGVADMRNSNHVFTPLLHALYRPDPDSRDQVRVSLTKSFRTPTMPSLMSRRISTRDANSPTNPDTMGNANLKPEVATGLDVAMERYLPQGGVLSATVFHRRIQDLIRNVVTQDAQGWVSMPQNISAATTQGVELEAKFRLDQWIANAPSVETRSNVSFYHSKVDSVPGPDNRLDQQPHMTANFGADYRLRSWPLTVGGNVHYNPGYDTRTSEYQLLTVSQKRVMDLYGLWRVDARTAWRLTLSNLNPHYYTTGSQYNNGSVLENANTRNRSWTNVQIMLEMKL